MKKLTFFISLFILVVSCKQPAKDTQSSQSSTPSVAEAPKAVAAVLDEAEKTEGFKLLFNGINADGWHTFKKEGVTWTIANGELSTKGGNGDLVTNEPYENFELRFEWKVGIKGNSGVMYMVQADTSLPAVWHTGIEYQIIDDKNWPDSLHDEQKSGAAYDLYKPKTAAAKDAGEWNTAKIIVNKGKVTHYINDQVTAEYVWNSPDFNKRVAASKFKAMPFAKVAKGHIALQDHGQEVAFRNIRIKTL